MAEGFHPGEGNTCLFKMDAHAAALPTLWRTEGVAACCCRKDESDFQTKDLLAMGLAGMLPSLECADLVWSNTDNSVGKGVGALYH